MKQFDYYIFIDYSETLIGYTIIEKAKIKEILPKLSRFRHYRKARDKRLYLKNIRKTMQKDDIISLFLKLKIRASNKTTEIYLDILEFLKKHENNSIFISVDNREYSNFRKMIAIVYEGKTTVKKESELIRGKTEYQISLVLDNILNIERLMKNGE